MLKKGDLLTAQALNSIADDAASAARGSVQNIGYSGNTPIEIEAAYNSNISVTATTRPATETTPFAKVYVISGSGGGLTYTFEPVNFYVQGTHVQFKLPCQQIGEGSPGNWYDVQRLRVESPLTLSNAVEGLDGVAIIGLDPDFSGGGGTPTTGYTGEVYIPANAQDGGSSSHYIAQDFENGLLKRVSSETPVGYPPQW